ncbi:MAG: hypothetical protein AUI14_11195 [Actinobacteria bacterium 13_2_20CM_2_71_6]|nr:MAG: hypothetical protein AUI14_11195 [Actinobacteria bacterium 13_2_20CM_2_71_6]
MTSSPKTETAQSTPPAASVSGEASPATSKSVDPCALLTPTDAQAVLHKTLGAGRKITTGDLNECAYDDAGPLVIAVLKSSFTKASFQQMIESQDSGPYAQTTGKGTAVAGLGDAAYSYDKAGIVEVLRGTTVLSVTSPSTQTSRDVARAVLPHLP